VEAQLQVRHLQKARKISEEQSKEEIKKPYLHLKENLEERHLQGVHQIKGMDFFFMVTLLHIITP
jgi:hypothetical protein